MLDYKCKSITDRCMWHRYKMKARQPYKGRLNFVRDAVWI